MRKVDRIRSMLSQGYRPKDIAAEVHCSLSLVYAERGRRDLAWLKHEIAEIRLELQDIWERLNEPVTKSFEAIEALLKRPPAR